MFGETAVTPAQSDNSADPGDSRHARPVLPSPSQSRRVARGGYPPRATRPDAVPPQYLQPSLTQAT